MRAVYGGLVTLDKGVETFRTYRKNGGSLPTGTYRKMARVIFKHMHDVLIETGGKIEIPFFGEIGIVKERKLSTGRNHYIKAGFLEYSFNFFPFKSTRWEINLYRDVLLFKSSNSLSRKKRLTETIVKFKEKNREVNYQFKRYDK